MPYDEVVDTWRKCMGVAYEPAKLLQRYEYQIQNTAPNQIKRPPHKERLGTTSGSA